MVVSLYRVIKRQIVSEKTSGLELDNTTFVFEVDPATNKVEIKEAIKTIYGVEPKDVKIVNVREKFKFAKRWMVTKRKEYKKAYVTLEKGNSIDLIKVK